MPKTVLKMYIDEERKARERSAKEELRGFLQAKAVSTREAAQREQAARREKDRPLTAKEKRDVRKQKKHTEKVESIPSSTVTEIQDFNIPGFRVVLEHLRRDVHCLLCPKLRVESALLYEVDENIDEEESYGTDAFEENDLMICDESGKILEQADNNFVLNHIESCTDDAHHFSPRLQNTLLAQNEDNLVVNLLPIIACEDDIEHTESVIRFTLDAHYGEAQQAFVLTIPRFYYPDGLTKEFIDQKIRDAVGRVFAEDEELLKTMSVITNKISVGHQEGLQLGKELAANNRAKAQQSYLHQQAQMKAVRKDKEERKWKRILSTTGAAREKSQNIDALAERDVMILRGELRGKYTMKSPKGLHEKTVDKSNCIVGEY